LAALVLAWLAVCTGWLAGCATGSNAVPVGSRYEFARPQMGMEFRLVIYAPTRRDAEDAAAAVFERVEQLNNLLSDYEEESELSRLNRTAGTGRWVPVSRELWEVLEHGQKMAAMSGGAFDVTVGPVVQLWRRARRQRELPDPDRLQRALAAVNWRLLELDPKGRRVRLRRSGMRLDLGGVAKGYVMDEALAVLRQRGLTRAMVQAGGDLAVGDPPLGRAAWRVRLTGWETLPEAGPSHVLLKRCALATSGDLFQFVEINGVRYSHIVDPRTGVGLTNHALVFVIASRGMTADALSTAVSVLGPEAGLRLVDSTSGAAARVVMNVSGETRTWETRRWSRYKEL
jgi:thiamine biosynthesis lipoprotein